MELGPKQRAWVVALRSGKYPQGCRQLHSRHDDGDRYCCLGVLCASIGTRSEECPVLEGGVRLIEYEGEGHYLPKAVYQEYGLLDDAGAVAASGWSIPVINYLQQVLPDRAFGSASLASLNDGEVPFAGIADVLEKFPEAYFTKSV